MPDLSEGTYARIYKRVSEVVRNGAIQRGASPAVVSDAQMLDAALAYLTELRIAHMEEEALSIGDAPAPAGRPKALLEHLQRGQGIIGCIPPWMLKSDEELRDTAIALACAAGELAGAVIHHAPAAKPKAAELIGRLLWSHMQCILNASSKGEEP